MERVARDVLLGCIDALREVHKQWWHPWNTLIHTICLCYCLVWNQNSALCSLCFCGRVWRTVENTCFWTDVCCVDLVQSSRVTPPSARRSWTWLQCRPSLRSLNWQWGEDKTSCCLKRDKRWRKTLIGVWPDKAQKYRRYPVVNLREAGADAKLMDGEKIRW